MPAPIHRHRAKRARARGAPMATLPAESPTIPARRRDGPGDEAAGGHASGPERTAPPELMFPADDVRGG